MMTTKMMKRTAVAALVGVLTCGGIGTAEVSAHALRADPRAMDTQPAADLRGMGAQDYEMTQLRCDHRRDRRDHRRRTGKRYSQGTINTAIIAGAVIGAIIAKNT